MKNVFLNKISLSPTTTCTFIIRLKNGEVHYTPDYTRLYDAEKDLVQKLNWFEKNKFEVEKVTFELKMITNYDVEIKDDGNHV